MSTAVIVALISSVASLVIAVLGAVWTALQNARVREAQRDLALLQHDLQRSAQHQDRQAEVKARLEEYRGPLLVAAYELGERIHNIQNRGFLAYLMASEPRRRTALCGTAFRFADFFGQQEIVHANLRLLGAADDQREPGSMLDLLGHIGRTFASDKLDWGLGKAYPSFMFWRDEQRAIGELMIAKPVQGLASCLGYATFAAMFDDRFAPWFATFTEDLETESFPTSVSP